MREPSRIEVELLAFAESADDAEQIAAYLTQRQIPANRVMIVALTLDAEHRLARTTWHSLPLQELTMLEDALPHLYAKAEEMGDAWYKALELKDDFYEQAATPHYRKLFHGALVSEHVLSEVFRGVKPGCVLVLPIDSLPSGPLSGGHASFPGEYGQLFNVLLRRHCRQQHIPIMETAPLSLLRRMALPAHPWQRFTARVWHEVRKPRLSLAAGAQTLWATFRRPLQPTEVDRLHQPDQQRFDVLILNWGIDLERNLRLNDIIANQAFSGLHILHLVWGKSPLPFLQPQPNHRIERPGKTSVALRVFCADFLWGVLFQRWRSFQRSRRTLSRTWGAWFAERQLDPLFAAMFFDVYLHAFLCRLNARTWVAKHQLKVLVSSDIDTVTFRSFLLAAREQGIRTLTTNHGFYLYEPPRSNFLAESCLVGGQALRSTLMGSGVPVERIEIIGNPTFDPMREIAARPVAERPTILIITASFGSRVQHQYRRTEYVQTLRRICDLATAHDAWQIVIKSHPANDHYELYDDMVAQLQRPNLSHVSVSWQRDQFKQATVAIAFADSGSLLELQSHGVPIVFVDGFMPPYHHPHVAGCGVSVATAQEAVQAVNQLIVDAAFRQEVVDRGYNFLRSYTDMPHNDVQRFAAILHRCVKNG